MKIYFKEIATIKRPNVIFRICKKVATQTLSCINDCCVYVHTEDRENHQERATFITAND